jgi:two-component system, cell cycle response regulator DivK
MASEPAKITAKASAKSRGTTAPRQALIVDADPVSREFYRRVLTGCGLQVRDTTSGVAAVTTARDWKPDIIIVDLQLPDVPGRQAVEWLRSIPGLKKTPVITIGWQGGSTMEPQTPGGEWASLAKPVSPRVLRQMIDRLSRKGGRPTGGGEKPHLPPAASAE